MTHELTERLERCYSGAVFDVLRGRGITDTILPHGILPLDPALTLAGPVSTLRGRRPGRTGTRRCWPGRGSCPGRRPGTWWWRKATTGRGP
jgi:4-hydroxy-4-methyl-2-oxoglutarate aldolase